MATETTIDACVIICKIKFSISKTKIKRNTSKKNNNENQTLQRQKSQNCILKTSDIADVGGVVLQH